MKRFRAHLWTFLTSEDGPTAVEYAVMLAMIILACVVTVQTLGIDVRNAYVPVINILGAGGP